MNIPVLSKLYPNSPALAQLYGGEIHGATFEKSFKGETITEQLELVNHYLKEQGFSFELTEGEFDDNGCASFCDLEFYLNPSYERQIIMSYSQPLQAKPLDGIMKLLNQFRTERDWQKFHTPKDLAMAMAAETGELLDLFLWDRSESVEQERIEEELADIVAYCLYLADHYDIDLIDAVAKKTIKNDIKYPVTKAKGSAKKYNKL